MKLSQLLIREDFYSLIAKTIRFNSFFKNFDNSEPVHFKSYKFLNIILHKSLETDVRWALIFEYTLSKSRIKQFLQNVYIRIIFLPGISELFCDKSILLPSYLSEYGVVPGNHRIRLFESSLNKITVLLKYNEASKFVKKDIEARFNNDLSYAPKILSFGTDWFEEEFINGVPFNRIAFNNSSKEALKYLLVRHNRELVQKNKKYYTTEHYFSQKISEMRGLINFLPEDSPVKRDLLSGVEKLCFTVQRHNEPTVEISITHGDFQEGNVRINSKNELFVLDWESADERFILYDSFVLLSGIRSGKSLKESFEAFFNNVGEYNVVIDGYHIPFLKTLICLEELLFNFNENISENFFNSGVDAIETLSKILDFIHSHE